MNMNATHHQYGFLQHCLVGWKYCLVAQIIKAPWNLFGAIPQTLHGTAIDAEKRPGVVPGGSVWGSSPDWQSHGVFGIFWEDPTGDRSIVGRRRMHVLQHEIRQEAPNEPGEMLFGDRGRDNKGGNLGVGLRSSTAPANHPDLVFCWDETASNELRLLL